MVQKLRMRAPLFQVPFPAHTHSGSRWSLTPVPENPMPSSGLCRYQTHMWYTNTHTSKTPIHIKINEKLKKTYKMLYERTICFTDSFLPHTVGRHLCVSTLNIPVINFAVCELFPGSFLSIPFPFPFPSSFTLSPPSFLFSWRHSQWLAAL